MENIVFILLRFLNGSLEEDLNTSIARTILNQINEFGNYSLSDAANICNVSESSIKRFCQKIGLSGYSELRKLLQIYENNIFKNNAKENIFNNYELIQQIDPTIIRSINQQIKQAKKVMIIGYGEFQFSAMYYQKQLFSLGKLIEIKHSYLPYLDSIDEDTFVMIISLSGTFVRGKEKYLQRIKNQIIITQVDLDYQPNIKIGNYSSQINNKYDLLYFFDRLLEDYSMMLSENEF